MKWILQLCDGKSLAPSDEELHVYEHKMPPLYFLVAQDSLEQVKLLLTHKVDVDCQMVSVYTPPLIATQDQQPDLCALRRHTVLVPTW